MRRCLPVVAALSVLGPSVCAQPTEVPAIETDPAPITEPATEAAVEPVQAPAEQAAAETPDGAPATDQPAEAPAFDLSQLPPSLLLGARSRAVHQAQSLYPVVVVVRDAPSYISAVRAWKPLARFPVLIDDGTDRAARDIARFVRAFDPERVVLYQTMQPEDQPDPWPPEQDAREAALRDAWFDTVGIADVADTWVQALTLMRARGFAPPGVVVTDVRDDAWTGALALAAGRLCPIVFVDAPSGGISSTISASDADEFASEIEDAIDALPLSWRALGDEIDALTLAIDAPGRMRRSGASGREFLAMTDRLGRHADGGSGGRWAWCAQIQGTSAQSAYRAMCALFLGFEDAWVFDGYPAERPWSDYDGTEAADALRQRGLAVTVHDLPDNAKDNWRLGVARGLDDDLLLVNSKGQANYFQTNPGYLRPGDVPILTEPTAVHMVHSFSLERPGNERTVGGRLLAGGAYAYIGSVHEPGLQAFVPTPIVARRLAAGMPWGPAGRFDNAPVWRLAVLGDPLMTMDPPLRRTDAPFPLMTALDIDEARAQAVQSRNFDAAVRMLLVSGRDEDLVRLASALLASEDEDLSPASAALAIDAAFREGRYELIDTLYDRLDAPRRREPANADPLWHGARVRMATASNADPTGVLGGALREGQREHDAVEIARHIERLRTPIDAASYLRAVRDSLGSERARRVIDREIQRLERLDRGR